MDMEKVIGKIAQHRNKKGFTYENMADELELTTAAYRKIETGETKLTVERLFKISNILETPVSEILDVEQNLHQQINYGGQNFYQETIEHFYQDNKDIMERLITAKDQMIHLLQQEIENLKASGHVKK